MGQLQANIKTINELDFSLFDIPFYQRPYRWQPSHVETLLNCILESQITRKKNTGLEVLSSIALPVQKRWRW